MKRISPKLISWASELEDLTLEQALRTSRLDVVAGHVALMPDAHFGLGATVGSVIPTRKALIPAAVGVDIGCGMVAAETDLAASALPDALEPFLPLVEKAVPSGVGKGHRVHTAAAKAWFQHNPPPRPFDPRQVERAVSQLGTLGSGNHFFEICLDERERVWIVLHSGSRGIGNELAQKHIQIARKRAETDGLDLEDRDLAYFTQGTPQFDAYVADLLWAQSYAAANRDIMIRAATAEFFRFVGDGRTVSVINCHHNYSQVERHGGQELWITRKGAIRAGVEDRGVIPGSMGTRSYIVRGKGNPDSYESCSHGAGRTMSRGAARRMFKGSDLALAMQGKTWQSRHAGALVDEIPQAYKDIDQVMEDQRDLVETEHTLSQILNYKGV